MPHWRPLVTAASATTIAALLTIGITGGHSPFAVSAPAQDPVANEVVDPTAWPDTADAVPTDDAASPTPGQAATPRPTARPRSSSSGGGGTTTASWGGSSGSSKSGGDSSTPRPTAKPTPRPTAKPTPEPTERPTPAPTQQQAGTLRVSDNDAGPRLSWTQCTSSRFAAYAVVRSLDSEIHYPAEDRDTVVALITSAGTTSLTDTGAPNSKVYYAVWCLSRSDGEYKTIWKTPTQVYAP